MAVSSENQGQKAEARFNPGDVIRYVPRTSHCRHGIAVIDERGDGRDTYWGDGEYSYVDPERLADGEFMFHLPAYRLVEENEWLKYAEEDRQAFPMGGYPRRLFVRSAAEPDLETQIQNARGKLAEAERELEAAGRSIRWATEDLVKLEAKRGR
jgi:hypothetical protein